MAKRRTEEAPVIAAILREEMALLRPEDRTDERLLGAVWNRIALEAPKFFQAVRSSSHSSRKKEGRAFRVILDEIHAELWKQPPFTSDRVIIPTLDAKYEKTGGKPAKGSVLRLERENTLRQLDALTLRMKVALDGEPWHRDANLPSGSANKALAAAFRRPEFDIYRNLAASHSLRMPGETEPPDLTALIAWHGRFEQVYREAQRGVLRELTAVIDMTIKEMEDERDHSHERRVHRPQEWAARALLRLMGQPEPIPWPDAVGLIKHLTREARQDEGEAPL